jgi:hypothetical protein
MPCLEAGRHPLILFPVVFPRWQIVAGAHVAHLGGGINDAQNQPKKLNHSLNQLNFSIAHSTQVSGRLHPVYSRRFQTGYIYIYIYPYIGYYYCHANNNEIIYISPIQHRQGGIIIINYAKTA